MSRLSEIFTKNKKCFIPFVTAGHPDLETSEKIILELAEAGAHIIEIGIPFSDPIADGPVIQRSSFAALQHGYSVSDYIGLAKKVRDRSDVGLIFMSYLNPLYKYGLERFDREATEAGVDGVLISDLTPEEYGRMGTPLKLDTIFLAAPTSSDERLQKICRASRGYVYVVARTGVTGTHSQMDSLLPQTIERVRRFTDLPVAVGFGIRSAEDVKKVWEIADGAIVGSAIVDFIDKNRSEADLAQKVGEYVREFLR